MPALPDARDRRTLAEPPEPLVRQAGLELFAALPRGRGPLERLHAGGMRYVSEDPALRAALFRLVDVAPACRSTADVGDHLGALLGDAGTRALPARLTRRLATGRRSRTLVGRGALLAVRLLASRFIAGRHVEAALPGFRRLWGRGVATTVDLLGEATVTEAEADAYARRCLAALERLAAAARHWPAQPRLESDGHGVLARANLSIKVSALTPEARPDDPARGVAGARERLRALLRRAAELDAHLHVDMESLDLRDTVTDLVLGLLEEEEFRAAPSVGLVLQGYLRDSADELRRWLDWAELRRRESPLTIRLVKGAYWDHEVVEARQRGWELPVFDTRQACDRNFELLTRRLLAHRDVVRVAIASHNIRSLAHALTCARQEHAAGELELQVLRGLGDDVQEALVRCGARVRAYCPVGDLVAGMAYLVRRLLENTSNDSFLAARALNAQPEALLAAP